jgi:anti-anti-sigma factor
MQGAFMEIKISEEGTRTLIELEGRLDTNTSPQLEEALNGLFSKGKNELLVDLAKCDFVSSAGLRVIVAAQKRVMAGGSLAFRNVQPEVMDVFEMTGFSKILTFE